MSNLHLYFFCVCNIDICIWNGLADGKTLHSPYKIAGSVICKLHFPLEKSAPVQHNK